jgi:hypothetical protein
MKTRLQIRQLMIPILLVSQFAQVAHAQRAGSASGWFANTDTKEAFLTYTTREVGIGGENVTVTHNVPYGAATPAEPRLKTQSTYIDERTGELRSSNSYYTPPAPVQPTTNVAPASAPQNEPHIGLLEQSRRRHEEAQRTAYHNNRREQLDAYFHVGPTEVFDGVIQEMKSIDSRDSTVLKEAYKDFSVPMLRILNWLDHRGQGQANVNQAFEAEFEASVKRYNKFGGVYDLRETREEFRKARSIIIYTLQSDPLALPVLLAAKETGSSYSRSEEIIKRAADVRQTRPKAFVNFVDNVLPAMLKALDRSILESRYQLQFSNARKVGAVGIDLKVWPKLIAEYIAPASTPTSGVRTCKGLF